MDRVERLGQESAFIGSYHNHGDKLGGHHKGCGTGGLPVVPTDHLGVAPFERDSHGPLHKTPDHEGQHQDQSQSFNAARRFEEQGIDDHGILEEPKILLYGMLVVIGSEKLL